MYILAIQVPTSRVRTQIAKMYITFNKACTWGCQRGAPFFLKMVIFPLFPCLMWKKLQIGTDMLLTITSTGDMLFSGINIDDLE